MEDNSLPDRVESRVMWSVTPDQTTSTYVHVIVEELRSRGLVVDRLRLIDLLASSDQIVHIQWPEHVSRGPGVVRTVLKHLRAGLLLGALRARGHRLIVTAHNRQPHHETDRFDAEFRSAVYKHADAVVALVAPHIDVLKQDGVIGHETRTEVIAHPLVTESRPRERSADDMAGPIVVLGQIDPYHLIEPFLDAADEADIQRRITVVGSVGDPDLVERLLSRSRRDSKLEVRAEFVPNAELDRILDDAAAIVALQVGVFNSGAPFDALPRGIPVVLSQGAQADELTETVGRQWVFSVPEPVMAEDLADLEQWLSQSRDLSLIHI